MTLGSCYIESKDTFSPIETCKVQIEGCQIGQIMNLEVTEIFKNTTEAIAQISYIFPNDLKICIYDTTFVVEDQIIKPKLISRKEARLIYKEAFESGQTAIYGSNIANGLTEFKLGNLLVNSEIRVILKMAFKANFVDLNTFYFKIPLDVYMPNGSVNCLNIQSNFSLNIKIDENIISITSNVKSGKFNIDEKTFCISNGLQQDNQNSIILHFRTQEKIESSLLISSDCDYCVASIVNNLPQKKIHQQEFVFIVDCSGSMKGDSIKNAGECLEIFIRSLPENSYFNIIRFGYSFTRLFNKSTSYNSQTRSKGISLAKSLSADLGGTNLLEPLSDLFSIKPIFDHRIVFILTDGEVTNREIVIDLVRNNSYKNQCFTIGFGRGCDGGLVEGIAEASRGKSDFVQEGDSISEKVIPQLQSAFCGSIQNIGIYCQNNDSFEIVPFPIPFVSYEKSILLFLHNKKNDKNTFNKGLLVTGE